MSFGDRDLWVSSEESLSSFWGDLGRKGMDNAECKMENIMSQPSDLVCVLTDVNVKHPEVKGTPCSVNNLN